MTRWKIVPLTPTRDMVARTVDAVFGGAVEDPAVIEEVYGAMLAAAPESPDGPIFNAAARAHAEALLNDPQAARAFLERANIVGPDGQLVPELRSDGDALEQLRERAELVAGNPRGDGTMRVAAADILALLNRANAADEARPVAVADVRHGVLVRSSLPVGYTGPLFAAPPHPAVEARIDPMQNPLRPTLAKLGPSGEHPAEEVLRKLACWLGVGGYNAPTVDAELFHRKIVDGIESLRAAPPQPAVEAVSDEMVEAALQAMDSHGNGSAEELMRAALVAALSDGSEGSGA